MASDGYYHGQQHNTQQPYYDPQPTPPAQSTAASNYDQSYAAYGSPYTPGAYGAQPHGQHPTQQQPGRPSPFDTVFDDQAYPAGSRTNLATNSGDISQQPNYYQDTGYYGQGTPSPLPTQSGDIPLQDRPGKSGDMGDHIYDVNGEQAPPRRPKNQKKIQLGELGMFGAGKKRIPIVTYVFTAVQIAVFIAEIVKNGILTKSPIMIKPQFNPMIGPSTYVLINMGARYPPCMHNIKEIQGSTIEVQFQCPNATSTDDLCPLSELCGFGGVPNPVFDGKKDQNPAPNQWFRFITPIFMHAGLIHIGFNLLLQMTLGKEMEMAIGPIRYFLVYMSAGIFGFIMGGNFAAPGIASTGASGSLFGIIALTLLDLLYSWKDRKNPVKELMFIFLDMIIAFVLGLLPGLDNFSHIGGFLMGLCLGICVLHSPNALRKRIDNVPSYSAVNNGNREISPSFFQSPLGFFKGRKPLWWAWWLVRVGVLIMIIVVFIVLLNNFYTANHTCKWCKYLSCIPVSNWCEIGTIEVKPA